MKIVGKFIRILLVIVIIAAGAGLAYYFVKTKPRAARRPPVSGAVLVEVEPLLRSAHTVIIPSVGTVEAAREVALQPQVAGRLVEVNDNLVPGGIIAAGELVARIDPEDYELAVARAEATLTKALHDLELEQGQQAIARAEYEMLATPVSPEEEAIILRRPQLRLAEANVDAARAALQTAQLNLERTAVRAPFTGMVREKLIEVGTQVAASTVLVNLVGTDRYWIRLTVPVDKLRWIAIPSEINDSAAPVRLYNEAAWGETPFRRGRVIRLAGDLENTGRMAQLLVAVDDPRSLLSGNAGSPELLLGMYLRAEIVGATLPDVFAIPRSLLRDEGAVWLMASDGTLDIRPVEIAYRGADNVYISNGLSDGELLITSELSAAVDGMALRTDAADTCAVLPAPPGTTTATGDNPRVAEKTDSRPQSRG